jgi:hypothetical protein
MCSKRKVKIKINVRDYVGVMENLGVIPKEDSEVREFTVDVEDNKDTYEYLLKASEILDWETIPEPKVSTWREIQTWPNNPITTPSPGWQPGIVYCNNSDGSVVDNAAKIKTVNLSSSNIATLANGATSGDYKPSSVTSKKVPSVYTSSGGEEVSSIVDLIHKTYGNIIEGGTILKLLQAIYDVKSKSPAFRFSKRTVETEILPSVPLQETLPEGNDEEWAKKASEYNIFDIISIVRSTWNNKESSVYEFLNNIFVV